MQRAALVLVLVVQLLFAAASVGQQQPRPDGPREPAAPALAAVAAADTLVKPRPPPPAAAPCYFWGNASSLPPVPQAPRAACPQYHTGQSQYDPSGPILQPDGTWHIFPDLGRWAHCSSRDLLRWNCSHAPTGFGTGDTGAISVTPSGTFALYPSNGISLATPTGPGLERWVKKGAVSTGST